MYGTVAERVDRGIKFLEAKKPNWRESLVNGFDIRDPFRCVLSRVFGTMDVGIPDPPYGCAPLSFLGFDVSGQMPESEYDLLAAEWQRRLDEHNQ